MVDDEGELGFWRCAGTGRLAISENARRKALPRLRVSVLKRSGAHCGEYAYVEPTLSPTSKALHATDDVTSAVLESAAGRSMRRGFPLDGGTYLIWMTQRERR
jgi:hypothetical protein